MTLKENGVIRDREELNPPNAKMSEDTLVVVTVKWNDQEETFTVSKE